jgi:hypothetical protein
MTRNLHELPGATKKGAVLAVAVSQKVAHFPGRSGIRNIKQQGCAPDRREYDPGIWPVATPTCNYDRLVIASLAIGAPFVRPSGTKSKNLISTTLDIAAEMSGGLRHEVTAGQRNSTPPGPA